ETAEPILRAQCHGVSVEAYALLADLPVDAPGVTGDPAVDARAVAMRAKPVCTALSDNPSCEIITVKSQAVGSRRASSAFATAAVGEAAPDLDAATALMTLFAAEAGEAWPALVEGAPSEEVRAGRVRELKAQACLIVRAKSRLAARTEAGDINAYDQAFLDAMTAASRAMSADPSCAGDDGACRAALVASCGSASGG
ncbi:MAG: hypothetical protein MI723_15110, partial [Caulobacterales bacterium]|nr:hypothetical protein [Caulobacterales bacterium]